MICDIIGWGCVAVVALVVAFAVWKVYLRLFGPKEPPAVA